MSLFPSMHDKNCELKFRVRSINYCILFRWMSTRVSLSEFSRRCGVSKGTIAKVSKHLIE